MLGYGRLPFITPEVQMSNLKLRLSPYMMAAIGVLAATGGVFRTG